MLMKDGEFLLSQIKQMVIRKENMRRNSRRPIGFQSISLIKYKKDYQLQLRYKSNVNEFSSGFITPQMLQQCRELPSLNPDFGVVKLNPYIFYSSVFAYDCILKKLNISNIH
jgi:abnormal spindle-like microcephaly-associated protein